MKFSSDTLGLNWFANADCVHVRLCFLHCREQTLCRNLQFEVGPCSEKTWFVKAIEIYADMKTQCILGSKAWDQPEALHHAVQCRQDTRITLGGVGRGKDSSNSGKNCRIHGTW